MEEEGAKRFREKTFQNMRMGGKFPQFFLTRGGEWRGEGLKHWFVNSTKWSSHLHLWCFDRYSASNGSVVSSQAFANPFDRRITIDDALILGKPLMDDVITDSHFEARWKGHSNYWGWGKGSELYMGFEFRRNRPSPRHGRPPYPKKLKIFFRASREDNLKSP